MIDDVVQFHASKNRSQAWLITGGAGYIGSHVVDEFIAAGLNCVVVDTNLEKTQTRVDPRINCFAIDICSYGGLELIFDKFEILGVIHFAALKSVASSQKYSEAYYKVNVEGTKNILSIIKQYGVKKLIFSSTAAVYGNAVGGAVSEEAQIKPLSVYGKTKAEAEILIEEASREFGLRFINLRYFNVAGARNKKLMDDSKDNLIPIVIDQISNSLRPKVFGNDYPTRDGTAIRDYIHIEDVIDAHFKAIDYLAGNGPSHTLNIGTGKGISVLEIINEVLKQKSSDLQPEFTERRDGDTGEVVANPLKAERVLGFKANRDLSAMISSVL